jgi:hypothetical protein
MAGEEYELEDWVGVANLHTALAADHPELEKGGFSLHGQIKQSR